MTSFRKLKSCNFLMKANLLFLFKIQQEFWQFSNFFRKHVSFSLPKDKWWKENKLTNSIFQIKWISTENTNKKIQTNFKMWIQKAPCQVAIELWNFQILNKQKNIWNQESKIKKTKNKDTQRCWSLNALNLRCLSEVSRY